MLGRDSGVIYQYVEGAVVLDGALDDLPGVLLPGHVRLHRQQGVAALGKPLLHAGQAFRVYVGHGYAGALRGEQLGGGRPYARGAARYDGGLVLKLHAFHASSPVSRSCAVGQDGVTVGPSR